jgi:hypothetical protein
MFVCSVFRSSVFEASCQNMIDRNENILLSPESVQEAQIEPFLETGFIKAHVAVSSV